MSNDVAHTPDLWPADLIGGRIPEFSGKPGYQYADLQDAEGNGLLDVNVIGKEIK